MAAPALNKTESVRTKKTVQQIMAEKQPKKYHSIPKYRPVIRDARTDADGKIIGEAKVIGRKWTGPRGKALTGTAKGLARTVWDKQRAIT